MIWGADIFTTSVFDRPLFSPDVIIHFKIWTLIRYKKGKENIFWRTHVRLWLRG